MGIIALTDSEVSKVAMCIKYALDSLEDGNTEACVDSLKNGLWYIGTTVEELNKLDEEGVWQ
jgi:hypothetical protein